MIFVVAALAAGIWPYARNFLWTGDPIFPFAVHAFNPAMFNARGAAALLQDTGATRRIAFWEILKFPFFVGLARNSVGFWEFFGPLCLLFTPMFVGFTPRGAAWRVALIVWVVSALGIGASSGMPRFLIVVFPVALASAFAGMHGFWQQKQSRAVRWLLASVVGATLAIGFIGLLFYVRPALSAAAGFQSREEYLRANCPEFASVEFINDARTVLGVDSKGMIFVRHLYRLDVPYVYGDPDGSWAVNPDRLQTAQEMLAFLRENQIRWVARGEKYPPSIAAPLEALEAEGVLVPIIKGEVNELFGMRISRNRKVLPITIVGLKD
jgi:hypothetical protein